MGANERITWWQEIKGTAQVIRNLEASRLATERLQRTNRNLASSQDEATKRGFLMNQVLFTGRRFLYAATLATVAFAGAMSALGFQFNLTMESNQVALTHFLGSAALTRKELAYLYQLAATTPFEFGDLTTATRKFLAFGFTLRDTNKYMKIIGDTVAGIGGSSADIEGLVTVFGQIQATGRVMGQDMLQLSQRGIPALQILKKELGLTNEQMAHMGDLAIPASVAIPALMRGMNRVFHGAAAEQAKTLQGQLSTLHDYAAQLMGTLTMPLFNRLRTKIIPQLGDMVNELQKAAKRGASNTELVAIIDSHIRAGGRLLNMYKTLAGVVEILRNVIFNGLLPTLYITSKVFTGIYLVIAPVLSILKFLTRQQWLLMAVMIPIVTMLSIEATLYLAVKTAMAAGMVIRILTLRWTSAMIIKQAVYNWLQLINAIRTKAVTRAEAAQFLMQMKLFRSLALLIGGYKQWKFWLYTVERYNKKTGSAIYANNSLMAKTWRMIDSKMIPALRRMTTRIIAQTVALWAEVTAWIALNLAAAGWILLSYLIVAGLIILYFKWKDFHDIVDKTWRLLTGKWNIKIFLPPFLNELVQAAEGMKELYKWAKRVYDLFRHPIRNRPKPTAKGTALGLLHRLDPIQHLPFGGQAEHQAKRLWDWVAASGGVVPRAGQVLVGESGPEIVSLPANTHITPLPQGGLAGAGVGGAPVQLPPINLRTVLEVDGRQLAEVVSRYRMERVARR